MAKASSKSSSQCFEVKRSNYSHRVSQKQRAREKSTRVENQEVSNETVRNSPIIGRDSKSKKVKKVSMSKRRESPARPEKCPSPLKSQDFSVGNPRKGTKIHAKSLRLPKTCSLIQSKFEKILLKLEDQFARRIDQTKDRLLEQVDFKLAEIQTQLRSFFEEVSGAQTPKHLEPEQEVDRSISNCFDQSPSLYFEARSERSARERNTPVFRTPLEEKFFTPSRADPSQALSPFSGLKPQFDISTSEPLETLPTLSSRAVGAETQKKAWSPFSFQSGDDTSLANHLRSYFQ